MPWFDCYNLKNIHSGSTEVILSISLHAHSQARLFLLARLASKFELESLATPSNVYNIVMTDFNFQLKKLIEEKVLQIFYLSHLVVGC